MAFKSNALPFLLATWKGDGNWSLSLRKGSKWPYVTFLNKKRKTILSLVCFCFFYGKRVFQFAMWQEEWLSSLMKWRRLHWKFSSSHFILSTQITFPRSFAFREDMWVLETSGIIHELKNKREYVRFLCAYYFFWWQLKKACDSMVHKCHGGYCNSLAFCDFWKTGIFPLAVNDWCKV